MSLGLTATSGPLSPAEDPPAVPRLRGPNPPNLDRMPFRNRDRIA